MEKNNNGKNRRGCKAPLEPVTESVSTHLIFPKKYQSLSKPSLVSHSSQQLAMTKLSQKTKCRGLSTLPRSNNQDHNLPPVEPKQSAKPVAQSVRSFEKCGKSEASIANVNSHKSRSKPAQVTTRINSLKKTVSVAQCPIVPSKCESHQKIKISTSRPKLLGQMKQDFKTSPYNSCKTPAPRVINSHPRSRQVSQLVNNQNTRENDGDKATTTDKPQKYLSPLKENKPKTQTNFKSPLPPMLLACKKTTSESKACNNNTRDNNKKSFINKEHPLIKKPVVVKSTPKYIKPTQSVILMNTNVKPRELSSLSVKLNEIGSTNHNGDNDSFPNCQIEIFSLPSHPCSTSEAIKIAHKEEKVLMKSEKTIEPGPEAIIIENNNKPSTTTITTSHNENQIKLSTFPCSTVIDTEAAKTTTSSSSSNDNEIEPQIEDTNNNIIIDNKDNLPFPISEDLLNEMLMLEDEFSNDGADSALHPHSNSPISTSPASPKSNSSYNNISHYSHFTKKNLCDDDSGGDSEDEDDIENLEEESDQEEEEDEDDDPDKSTNHDFVADYLQLESMREVNHISQVMCRAKICRQVEGADANLSLEQLKLAKSHYLQLPCFDDMTFFTKIKVPPEIFMNGKRTDEDLVKIQYLQTKMDDLHQKKLKKNTDNGESTKDKHHQQKGGEKGARTLKMSPKNYVKSLEQVLRSLQLPQWTKDCSDSVEEDEEEEEENDGSTTEDDNNGPTTTTNPQQSTTTSSSTSMECTERAALAKRILNMYKKGQLNKTKVKGNTKSLKGTETSNNNNNHNNDLDDSDESLCGGSLSESQ